MNHLRQKIKKISEFFVVCLNNYVLPPEYMVFRNMNDKELW